MSSNLVTSEVLEPYAQALMSVAQSNDLVDRFGEDVSFILSLLDESSELEDFLANPLVNADAKKNVLAQLTSETIHPFVLNFLRVLVDRRRILFLRGVCKQYQSLLRQLRQTVLADVTSAVELNDEQKEAVRQKVVAMTGAQQVELDTRIDPELIGGVIIKVGSQVVDASLRGQLRRIGIRLNSAA
ncbi:F0F1 ATP synthase subunit delta [Oscillatoria sp. FACHB-1407]|uniref:ATP synthase F1 subunit delta n=1 Tax=Oscillatoria sp. FACHB-1407 TaxID=2692847 RepID=UPI001682BB80|nr:ATP synthase F1 subunit delta [Oscillatoria sp. FACHB-1407]MBD2462125.1 F0F1 ATP synthase subunit delta [Oscillatoria sp. FACHB-1407]